MRARIQIKREELEKRKNFLAEAHKLLEDQHDDASKLDMHLHAERYDGQDLHPKIMLNPLQ